MDALTHDLRHAFRQLRRRPGFAILAILVLGLGIGAATAIFSVVDALLLRSLPYEEPDRVVTVWESQPAKGIERGDVAPANFLDWREQAGTLEIVAAAEPYARDYTGGERPQVFLGALVTEGFFRALGVRPVLGRTFLPEEFEHGRAVLLTHGAWQGRFGGDPSVVGRAIPLDGEPYTVAGVLPPWFEPALMPTSGEREIWMPRVLQGWEAESRRSKWWTVVARLADGASREQAQAELDAISARLAADHPDTNRGLRAVVLPLREHLVAGVRPVLLTLQAAVLLLLLIACANVSSLLLARGAERERELALHSALGAGRGRIVVRLLAESLAVAAVGCLAGVVLAYWGLGAIEAVAPVDVPRLDEAAIDARVLGFAAALSVLAALAAGLAPALQLSRPDLRSAMQEGRSATAGAARRRVRGGLVVTEIALALVLVVGAALLVRSFAAVLAEDPGFERSGILALQVFIQDERDEPDERRAFMRDVLARLEGLPGVRAAGAVSAMPFIEANLDIQRPFTIEGRPPASEQDRPNTYVVTATPDYFPTMGIPVLEGRGFGPGDDADAPGVVVINREMARRHWGDDSPVGRRVMVGVDTVPREIVGVVGEVRHEGFEASPRPELFFPYEQAPWGGVVLVARADGVPAEALVERAKEEVWAVEPNQTFYRTATIEELVSRRVAGRRFAMTMLGGLAGMALLLAVVGIYGVVSYTTRRRTQEIGIRMALGAERADVLRDVLWEGGRLALLGIAIGVGAALLLTRLLDALLYGIAPTDPVTFAAVPLVLLAAALLATLVPAHRATGVDPALALREE